MAKVFDDADVLNHVVACVARDGCELAEGNRRSILDILDELYCSQAASVSVQQVSQHEDEKHTKASAAAAAAAVMSTVPSAWSEDLAAVADELALHINNGVVLSSPQLTRCAEKGLRILERLCRPNDHGDGASQQPLWMTTGRNALVARDAVLTFMKPIVEQLHVLRPAPAVDDSGDAERNARRRTARALYATIAPTAFAVAMSAGHGSAPRLDAASSASLHANLASCCFVERETDSLLRFLLDPLVADVVKPRERELSFHFQLGKKSANPRHLFTFFSYLENSFRSVIQSLAAEWTAIVVLKGKARKATVALNQLACIALAHTAAVVFVSAYTIIPPGGGQAAGYRGLMSLENGEMTSKKHTLLVTHTINSTLDFVERICSSAKSSSALALSHAAQWFATCVMSPEIVGTFFSQAMKTCQLAYENGSDRLWRLYFLRSTTNEENTTHSCGDALVDEGRHQRAFSIILKATSCIRAVTALVRRCLRSKSVVATPLPIHTALWDSFVAPCVAFLLRRIDASFRHGGEPECESDSTVMDRCALLVSAHDVYAAADEWYVACEEVFVADSTSKLPALNTREKLNANVLDSLLHWNDNAVNATMHELRRCRNSEGAAGAVQWMKQVAPRCPATVRIAAGFS